MSTLKLILAQHLSWQLAASSPIKNMTKLYMQILVHVIVFYEDQTFLFQNQTFAHNQERLEVKL